MFMKSAKSVLAAVAITVGATFAAPAMAEWPGNSENLYVGGSYGGLHIGIGQVHKPAQHVGHKHYKHRKHRNHYGHAVRQRGHCGPRRALHKAWNIGVNRPHIARLNNERIVVVGYNRGHRAKVVFKRNSHHCRVIKTRGIY